MSKEFKGIRKIGFNVLNVGKKALKSKRFYRPIFYIFIVQKQALAKSIRLSHLSVGPCYLLSCGFLRFAMDLDTFLDVFN